MTYDNIGWFDIMPGAKPGYEEAMAAKRLEAERARYEFDKQKKNDTKEQEFNNAAEELINQYTIATEAKRKAKEILDTYNGIDISAAGKLMEREEKQAAPRTDLNTLSTYNAKGEDAGPSPEAEQTARNIEQGRSDLSALRDTAGGIGGRALLDSLGGLRYSNDPNAKSLYGRFDKEDEAAAADEKNEYDLLQKQEQAGNRRIRDEERYSHQEEMLTQRIAAQAAAAEKAAEKRAEHEKIIQEGKAGSPEAKRDRANEIIYRINNIKKHPGFKSAVGSKGASSLFFINREKPFGGTNAADFVTEHDALSSLLTTENLGLMKGVLSNTDIAILKAAATSLDRNKTESGYLKELNKIEEKVKLFLDKVNANSAATSNNDPMGLYK